MSVAAGMSRTFDPFDAEQAHGAWPLLSELRRETPLATLSEGMKYVTRLEESRAVLRDTTAFSNARGFKAPGVIVPPEDRILAEMDPPWHTAVRRVMVTALSPKVVHAAEDFIEATARDLLAQVPDRGTADLVPAFTVPLPNRVTVHLLGFPAEDADTIAAWAKELMESGFPATNRSHRGEGFANAFPDFAGYIDDRIAARTADLQAGRDDHPDEVLTRLVKLEVDGSHLEPRQLRALVRNLITGGLTTTSQLLGNLVHDALTVPEVEAALRRGGATLDTAMEESLRLRPPVMFIVRGCVADTEVGGCPVHDGDRLVIGSASANRDERVFDDADELRLDRPNADQHLTFGFGPHVCPGATLARAVTRIGLRVLFERFRPGRSPPHPTTSTRTCRRSSSAAHAGWTSRRASALGDPRRARPRAVARRPAEEAPPGAGRHRRRSRGAHRHHQRALGDRRARRGGGARPGRPHPQRRGGRRRRRGAAPPHPHPRGRAGRPPCRPPPHGLDLATDAGAGALVGFVDGHVGSSGRPRSTSGRCRCAGLGGASRPVRRRRHAHGPAPSWSRPATSSPASARAQQINEAAMADVHAALRPGHPGHATSARCSSGGSSSSAPTPTPLDPIWQVMPDRIDRRPALGHRRRRLPDGHHRPRARRGRGASGSTPASPGRATTPTSGGPGSSAASRRAASGDQLHRLAGRRATGCWRGEARGHRRRHHRRRPAGGGRRPGCRTST